jgi:hypothetical protein
VNKKLSQWLVVFFIAATLIIPTMVYANKNDKVSPLGAEDWVGLLNSEYGVYLSRWVTTRPVNSDGGYIKVCMSGVNVGNTITVNVFEKDVALKDCQEPFLMTVNSETKVSVMNIFRNRNFRFLFIFAILIGTLWI